MTGVQTCALPICTLSLGEEIRREIESADEICFIVSFLKFSGVRILLDNLKKFCSRQENRLRIITTTYCGATQAKAIEQLANLPNTEIRICVIYLFVKHNFSTILQFIIPNEPHSYINPYILFALAFT